MKVPFLGDRGAFVGSRTQQHSFVVINAVYLKEQVLASIGPILKINIKLQVSFIFWKGQRYIQGEG